MTQTYQQPDGYVPGQSSGAVKSYGVKMTLTMAVLVLGYIWLALGSIVIVQQLPTMISGILYGFMGGVYFLVTLSLLTVVAAVSVIVSHKLRKRWSRAQFPAGPYRAPTFQYAAPPAPGAPVGVNSSAPQAFDPNQKTRTHRFMNLASFAYQSHMQAMRDENTRTYYRNTHRKRR